MTTTFHIRVRSIKSGESLIISDEYSSKSRAEHHMEFLIAQLKEFLKRASLEDLHTWLTRDFLIELVEDEAINGIETNDEESLNLRALDDFDMMMEFMEEAKL